MANLLQLTLFGSPEIRRHGQPVTGFRSSKAQALLYYLAVTGRVHTRPTLAGLFWGDQPEAAARTSLSKCLSNLRELMGDAVLIERQTVTFNRDHSYQLDTERFMVGVGQPPTAETIHTLQAALALYRGDFLEGFYVREAPDFEQWVLIQRAYYREAVVQGLHTLANYVDQQGDLPTAITHTRRLLTLEPWREEAHRQLMTRLARSGQRAAALAQFETCRRILDEELAVEPDGETETLVRQIRAGEWQVEVRSLPSQTNSVLPYKVPIPLTPLIGREQELVQLEQLLNEPTVRLLTILGPGGIGKTYLALTVAQRIRDRDMVTVGAVDKTSNVAVNRPFVDGIYFVALTGLELATGIVSAVAAALGFVFYQGQEPQRQLIEYLRTKHMLLILDSIEHLLKSSDLNNVTLDSTAFDGTEFIRDLLQNAAHLKIVITSRSRLNLQSEYLFPLGGLAYPEQTIAASTTIQTPQVVMQYSAVQLFVQQARRRQPSYMLLPTDSNNVARICQLVQGMPLAVELAATWMSVRTPTAIANEIAENLDFLASATHDLPVRQRSIRAVFNATWSLLIAEERRIFMQLSVFRGGFTYDAARQVTDATLAQLGMLVDKSLLEYRQATDRFELHRLLRQYGEEQLHLVGQQAVAQNQHCAYYTHFVQARLASLTTAKQLAAIAELNTEINNLRAAWRYAFLHQQYAAIRILADGFSYFYELSCLLPEGALTFHKASEMLRSAPDASFEFKSAFGFVLAFDGYFFFRQGNLARCQQMLQESLEILRAANDWSTLVIPLAWLGVIAALIGNYTEAEHWLAECTSVQDRAGFEWGRWLVAWAKGLNAHSNGDYHLAKQYFTQSLAYCRQSGDPRATTNCLNFFSRTCLALHEYAEAERLLQESLAISQASQDRFGTATSLNHLGVIAIRQQNYAQGQVLLRNAAALFGAMGDSWSQTRTLNDSGQALLAVHNHADAQECYAEALQIALNANITPHALMALTGLAEVAVAAHQGQHSQALTWLFLIETHAHTLYETKEQVVRLRTALAAQLLPEQVEHARLQAQTLTLEATVASLKVLDTMEKVI